MDLRTSQQEFIENLQSKKCQRHQLYKNNITNTFITTLMAAYPQIVKLIGNNCFNMLAHLYQEQYPARESDLFNYGAYFDKFLATHSAVSHLVYLEEVAKFEWAYHQSYYAQDTSGVAANWEHISETQFAALQFELHPACHLLNFKYPILEILALCEGKRDEIDLDADGVNLLVYRYNGMINLLSISADDFAFLSAIAQGSSILEALVLVGIEFKLDQKLPKWIAQQIIVNKY